MKTIWTAVFFWLSFLFIMSVLGLLDALFWRHRLRREVERKLFPKNYRFNDERKLE